MPFRCPEAQQVSGLNGNVCRIKLTDVPAKGKLGCRVLVQDYAHAILLGICMKIRWRDSPQ